MRQAAGRGHHAKKRPVRVRRTSLRAKRRRPVQSEASATRAQRGRLTRLT